MRRFKMYFAAIAIIVFTAAAFTLFASGEDESAVVEFLGDYGWEVGKKPVEEADIIIPDPFDLVYENYNELQIRAGLDLSPYKGEKCRRYTYIVTNYPAEVGEDVRANVICHDGKPIGGDIMTVSLRGFMHSLLFSDSNNQ